ncbi:MAG: hypothetical protein QM529_06215 [Hydrotalea sp.]|nr:hypothetical protein [Hydrotalea sp.]
MKKNLTFVLLGAVLAWLIPMAVSFFMVDPSTTPHTYLPNIYVFKAVMFLLASGTAWFFYKKLQAKKSLDINVAHVFLAVSVVLDMALLVSVFKMPLFVWLTMVFPCYPIAFYGLYFFLKRKK